MKLNSSKRRFHQPGLVEFYRDETAYISLSPCYYLVIEAGLPARHGGYEGMPTRVSLGAWWWEP